MMLNTIQFISLNKNTWVAHANIVDSAVNSTLQKALKENMVNKLGIQRLAVRELLQSLLLHLNMIDQLDESVYPYRLNTSKKYVCFTHSEDAVAVIISDINVGIDIENNEVPWKIAKRFFHPDELASLSKMDMTVRSRAIEGLWQLKESLIKVTNNTLVKGLAINCTDVILPLLEIVADANIVISSIKYSIESNPEISKIYWNPQLKLLAVY